MLCILVEWFFFFKQKTAYEMRISDWSSDVCSSDLLHRGRLRCAATMAVIAATLAVMVTTACIKTTGMRLGQGWPGDQGQDVCAAMEKTQHCFHFFPRRQDRKSTRLNSSH